MTLPVWQAILITLLAAACCRQRFQGWLYLFQLDEYQPGRLRRTLAHRLRANWRWQGALLLGALAAAAAAYGPGRQGAVIPLLLAALLPLATDRGFGERGALRWTARARRLGLVSALISLAAVFLAMWSGWPGALLVGLVDLLLALSLVLAQVLLSPLQWAQRHRYMAEAEARLRRVGPLVIGITGSYGKTTTKNFLRQLLDSPESPCFATPESYNTTLGVCRAVNEGLRPEHRYAVLEMGAYRPGEIAEICSFTHPRVGVITAVGVMHLERFGSRERIAEAKSELFRALPPEGLAVAPSRVDQRRILTSRLRSRALWIGAPGDRWWAEEFATSVEGSSFRLRGSGGEDLRLRVPVHGLPIVQDLLCAWAVAAELGLPLELLRQRCAGLQGVPHRLEVSQAGGITIIDDAYNSNPDGAAEALRLLAALPGQRRVLVTPGYVELGPLQEESMRELGRRAAGVCSHVILVGPRHSAGVRAGLEEAGYPGEQLTVVASLEAAQQRLPEVAGAGSIVLFENDLPDSFLEAG